jgi:hypothetical protein
VSAEPVFAGGVSVAGPVCVGGVSLAGPVCVGGVSLALCAIDLRIGLTSGDGRGFALCAVDPNPGPFEADDAFRGAVTGASLAGNCRTDLSAAPLASGTKPASTAGSCANSELARVGASNKGCGSISATGGGERSGVAKSAFTRPTPKRTPTVAAPTSPSENR